MSTGKSDTELVAACREGRAWAWEALVDRYKRLIYSIPLRAGLSADDAADVFQTVFARLVEHLHAIREPQALAAWLITTAKRSARTKLPSMKAPPCATTPSRPATSPWPESAIGSALSSMRMA